MLLFIGFMYGNYDQVLVFQYISCYCLSETSILSLQKSRISIHLMLLFIFIFRKVAKHIIAFQYISCYCLSLVKALKSGAKKDFNTSHVTVYLKLIIPVPILERFQYISCYCLSNELTPFYIFLRI